MHRSSGAAPADAAHGGAAKLDHAAPPSSPARRRVIAAFEAAIDDALAAAARVESDPIRSVHAFRRAARRAHAILAVVASEVSTPARLEIGSALRSAIRDTSTMRDRDVLPSTLASLPLRHGTEEARAELEAALLAGRARKRRPLSRVRRLAVAAARLGLLPERFDAALAAELEAIAIGEGVARLARRARSAVKSALDDDGGRDAIVAAHRARKRVRRLAASIDALLGAGSRMARRARELARLSMRIGKTLDLERLASFARARARGTVQDDAAHARLLEQLDRRPRRRRLDLFTRAARLLERRRWKPERLSRPVEST